MLNCRSCLWRCIRALESAHTTTPRLRHDAASALPLGGHRGLRTSTRPVRKVEARPRSLSAVERAERDKWDSWRASPRAAGLKRKEKQGLRQYPRGGKTPGVAVRAPPDLGRREASIPLNDWNRRRRELQYLTDPLELATFVTQELRKDKEAEMLQLVRMASRTMQCVVSWNHLIDYNLANGRVAHAFKIYNDMKKRAQFPDSYTYTILLRGLSINANDSGVLEKALSVYHSMSAENSRVEPTIIHTNAVLKVCARAMNMDALWGVAAKIPDSGPGAASQVTYTTILNAIRQSLLVNIPVGETDEQIAERRDRGVIEGRRVWEEIIGKWRNADLIIGEELVCSMGRLLLVGARPQDWDDVLSLVEQTMDVKRQVPRLGSPDRIKAGFPRLRGPHIPEQYRTEDGHLRPSQGSERGEEFLPVRTGKPQDNVFSSPLTYATPSNNTLSMVQEACQKIVAVKAADEYWDLLTDPRSYSVNPDLDNIHFRLRVLRQYRASAETVKLLKDSFATKKLQARPGTFRIAISACARDSNNHNSIKHAGQIVDIMMKTLEDADPKVVAKYAGLMKGSPTAKGPDIMDALARLHPVVRNLRVQLSVGMEDRGHLKGVVQLNAAQENDAVDALRQIYGLVDKLLLSHLISDELKKPFKKSRATLASFLHRFAYKSGNWRGKPDGDNGGLDAKEDQNAETDPLQELSQDTVEKSGRKPRWLGGRNGDLRKATMEATAS